MLLPGQAVAGKENDEGGARGAFFCPAGREKRWGGGVASTWRRGGEGLDTRCTEGSRQRRRPQRSGGARTGEGGS
jgi:hypothetical protein